MQHLSGSDSGSRVRLTSHVGNMWLTQQEDLYNVHVFEGRIRNDTGWA